MHYFTLLYLPDGTLNSPCCAVHLDQDYGGLFTQHDVVISVEGKFSPGISISLPCCGSGFSLRTNQKFDRKKKQPRAFDLLC